MSTVLGEAAYKKNITLHRAINKVLYEVVFGMLPGKEIPRRTEDDHIEESEQHTTPVLKMTFWHRLRMQTLDNLLWLTYKWNLQLKTSTNASMPSMNV